MTAGVGVALDRLTTWLGNSQLPRLGVPTYKNPGELKDDLRLLLADRAALVAERDEAQSRERHSNRRTHELAAHVRQAVAERDRYRDALETIKKMGVVSDAKATRSKEINALVRDALAVSTP